MALAGFNPMGRHRSVDAPKILRTPLHSPKRVRASYYTLSRPLILTPKHQKQQQQQTKSQLLLLHRQQLLQQKRNKTRVSSSSSSSSSSPLEDPFKNIAGSAESLVGKFLETEGIGKYVDAKLVQNEISEVSGLTVHQLDVAASQILKRSASLRSTRGAKKAFTILDEVQSRSNSCKDRKRVRRRIRRSKDEDEDSVTGLFGNSFNYNKLRSEKSPRRGKRSFRNRLLREDGWMKVDGGGRSNGSTKPLKLLNECSVGWLGIQEVNRQLSQPHIQQSHHIPLPMVPKCLSSSPIRKTIKSPFSKHIASNISTTSANNISFFSNNFTTTTTTSSFPPETTNTTNIIDTSTTISNTTTTSTPITYHPSPLKLTRINPNSPPSPSTSKRKDEDKDNKYTGKDQHEYEKDRKKEKNEHTNYNKNEKKKMKKGKKEKKAKKDDEEDEDDDAVDTVYITSI